MPAPAKKLLLQLPLMNKTLTYALLVFLAGSSYGFIVPAIKIAESADIHAADFLPLQYLMAFFLMAALTMLKHIKLPTLRELAKLACVGILTACTSLCYYRAVALLPSAVALTLLFQFVWIGIILNAITQRRLPGRTTVLAVIIVLVGTVLAAGIFDMSIASLNPAGIAFGLGSAVFYSLFLFVSGRISSDYAVPLRTTMLSLGGFITTTAMNPGFVSVVLDNALTWPVALVMSFLGIIIPTSLISLASPKLDASVVTIMASSELPVGVLAAWVIVADTPTPAALAGVILVLAGIVYNQWPALKGILRKNQAN